LEDAISDVFAFAVRVLAHEAIIHFGAIANKNVPVTAKIGDVSILFQASIFH
jgi:hypothetical protein